LADAKSLELAGLVPHTDVLRADAEVQASKQARIQADGQRALAEEDLKVRIGAATTAHYLACVGSDTDVAPLPQPDIAALVAQATQRRPELSSLRASEAALGRATSVARTNEYPQFAVFGDATLANPNARAVPQSQSWLGTWAVGAQLTWSPSDALGAMHSGDAAAARLQQLDAQRTQLLNGLRMEVTRAVIDGETARNALAAAQAGLLAAEAARASTRDAYKAGKATASNVVDLDALCARTALAVLSAKVDARIAAVRLRLAIGGE
jgi:outer membrane protein